MKRAIYSAPSVILTHNKVRNSCLEDRIVSQSPDFKKFGLEFDIEFFRF